MASDIILVEDVALDFDLSVIGRKLRIRPEQDRPMEQLARLAKRAGAVARPRAAVKLCAVQVAGVDQVLVEGVGFTSPLLREKLVERGRAFPYWSPKGWNSLPGPWALALSWSRSLPRACGRQRWNRPRRGWKKRFWNGTGEAGVGHEPRLPAHLVHRRADIALPAAGALARTAGGVRLSPSLMMEPAYSISGIFFQTDTKYYNCQLCPREDCPNRKAPSTLL